MHKIKPEIRFSFPAVLAVILCTDTEGAAVLCLLTCGLHELGHIFVMLICNNPPEKIIFCGGGIRLSGNTHKTVPVIIGGCTVNFLLFTVFYPFTPFYTLKLFGMINLLTGLFNLVPVKPLDGYFLFEKALIRFISPEKIDRVLRITEIIASLLFVPMIILFFIMGMMNFSSLIFLFYIFAVDIFEEM